VLAPMVTKVVPGQLVASQDADSVARDAASRMAKLLRAAIARGGRGTLALSGGNTPRVAYGLLARESGLDWSKVEVFWVDERAVPPTDDRSNYRHARETLIEAAGIPADRVHRMPGEAPDLDAAARDYEKAIRACVELDGEGVPAFDVMVLGVGDDGHTASLFPGESTVDIHDRLVVAVPAKGSREARLTLTATAIEAARNVLLLVVGEAKRPALERAWAAKGDVHETSSRVVRGCRGAVTWVIDRAAGGLAE
jgi:6-phosphogluconolactonase